jgi:hypothetical protein
LTFDQSQTDFCGGLTVLFECFDAVLMDTRREKEAIAELSRAIAFKADLQVLHLRAAFHECIGDLQASLRDCRAVLSMDPNHQDTLELHNRVHGREAY